MIGFWAIKPHTIITAPRADIGEESLASICRSLN
jgi:hypothetical protein